MQSAYVVENLLANGTVTSSTEDSAFPLSSLYDEILGRLFAFTSTAGGWIEVDHGEAKAFDTLAIHNHNFDASVDIDVYAGATPNPATPIATNLTYRERELWADLGSQSERYVRIVITDSNSENTSIGQLVLGSRVELPEADRYGRIPGAVSSDIIHETQAEVTWAYHKLMREIREYLWRILESQLPNFETQFKDVLGRVHPYTWIQDLTESDVMYVRNLATDYRPRELSEPMVDPGYEVMVKVRQESYGATLS